MVSHISKEPKSPIEAGSRSQSDHEIKAMVSALTQRLLKLQSANKPGSSHDDGDNGPSVITIAGTNSGATMHTSHDGKLEVSEDSEPPGVYANSNFQAFNNSIMLNGSYNCDDPGVHLIIKDTWPEDHGKAKEKKEKSEELDVDGKKRVVDEVPAA